MELGAFKIELAGACWQVPEFATISANNSELLSTFKDLFIYESVQRMLPTNKGFSRQYEEQPPFGSVQLVIAELFGSGGMLRAMRHNAGSTKVLNQLKSRASAATALIDIAWEVSHSNAFAAAGGSDRISSAIAP